jgi:EAL domain-containing protein (putative c-di-GMP-specific phosphodiesterase class I)
VSAAASIGIAFDAGHTPETLLRDADTALYRAKDRGKNRYEVFDESLRAAALRKVSTEALLRRALDDDQLQVHYQPVVDLVTGEVIGAEALLRVPGPGGELQSPAEFIIVADETGLIVPIGAGVLDDACRTIGRWQPDGSRRHHVAVNVSSRQLASTGFADVVERALDAHGLRGDQLVLELTETALIQADRVTTEVLERLHGLGVGLAIDDFGTGYGSLAYLKRFPITTVKIDRSFVAGLGAESNDTEIVRAITSLGRSLGLFVIAEGIETVEQLEQLQALGCDAGQGYLFAAAGPADGLGDVERRVSAGFPARR